MVKWWVRSFVVVLAAGGGWAATSAGASAKPAVDNCIRSGLHEACVFVDVQDAKGHGTPRDRVSASADTAGMSDATGVGLACDHGNLWWLSASVAGYAQVVETPLPVNCP
jgi:hypothetical protein